MSWRDRLVEGSFRNSSTRPIDRAIFHVNTDTFSSGRRAQVHEFPYLQRPYTEDMGKKSDEFEISAFLIGDDFDLARNKLIQELKKPGNGKIVHPNYGEVAVNVLGFDVKHDKNSLGMCTVTMRFVESGSLVAPRDDTDGPSWTTELSIKGKEESRNIFNTLYDIGGRPAQALGNIRDTINGKLSFIDGIRQGVGALSLIHI